VRLLVILDHSRASGESCAIPLHYMASLECLGYRILNMMALPAAAPACELEEANTNSIL
jgi:hypothetical protein